LKIFRHIAQESFDRRQSARMIFTQSDKKSVCASARQSLCGVALKYIIIEEIRNMENSLFPIKFQVHIVLALLALLVFGLQFIRFRKSHHLVLAIAFPCTLLPYLTDNMTFFYMVGLGEAAALLMALIMAKTVDKPKKVKETSAGSAAYSELPENVQTAQTDVAEEDAEA
jgi:hypothetical protein